MNESEALATVIALVGIAIGIVARTYAPYLKKLAEGKIEKFERKYLYSAVLSFVIALGTAKELIGSFDLAAETPWYLILILAVLFGAMWNDGVNRSIWWKG